MRISEEAKQSLRALYNFSCAYCGVSETNVGAELTIDHFHPRSRGGSDAMENLVYCCHTCNIFKGDYWQPGAVERILHPRNEILSEHISDEDGLLVGLTATGIFHINRLRLNRSPLIDRRRELQRIEEERLQSEVIRRELQSLELELQNLRQSLDDLEV